MTRPWPPQPARWKQPPPADAALFEPAINIILISAHLKEMSDRINGQLPLALAAYNAGPDVAQRWLPARAMDPDMWIENIPCNETRTYVQRIPWHTVVFAWLDNTQPQDKQDWLKSAQAVTANR